MNLTTLIQKKGAIFGLEKFTKALDEVFGIDSVLGGDFNNKATINDSGRLIIQYTSKIEGCVVFHRKDDDITVKICRSKSPEECITWNYQIYNIRTTATLRQFKKFLASVIRFHYYIAKQVEINQEIGKEMIKLDRLVKQVE